MDVVYMLSCKKVFDIVNNICTFLIYRKSYLCSLDLDIMGSDAMRSIE